MSLKKKTISGLKWSFLSQGGKQASQFVITVILARMLSPDDFGLLGMATVFTGFANLFGELGITSALIQKQDTREEHLSSAFWLNVSAGLFLTLIFIGLSPWIARFYHKPELSLILSVISFNFILSSFTVVQQAILTKEMDFKSLMIRDIAAMILSGILGIFLAYHGAGVWSLVYQLLSFTLFNSIFLWTFSKWRPQFIFSRKAITDIFHFSAHMTGFNVVNYFARNVDYLLIGKFLGTEALGYYTLAYKLMMVPVQNISGVIGKVMFPAFSRIQHDLEKVRINYMKMVKVIPLVTFPMMFGLFALAPEFVRVVYGPKWEDVIILIRILSLCGVIQSVGTTIGNIWLSLGKADLQFKMQVCGTIIVTGAILLGLKWGLQGVAILYLAYSIVWVHYSLFVTCKLINLKFSEFYRVLFPAYGVGLGLLFCLLAFKKILMFSSLANLSILIITGSILYLIFLFFNGNIRILNSKISLNFD